MNKGTVLLRQLIRETLLEGRPRDAEDPGDDAPEYESVDAFALSKDDEGGDSFTHLDLQALARRRHGVPAPSFAQVRAVRSDLEAYGLKLSTREPPRDVRGVTSSVNGRHPFAGSGGGGTGFSSGWGGGGFTSFGGGPGAIGGGYAWDPKDKKNLSMGSGRR